MPELGKDNKKTSASPLPKDFQDLVDKEEEDLEIRVDYENSWTTTWKEWILSKQNQLDHLPWCRCCKNLP
ncbi:hypothetical protein N7491_011022 [Penicillium cf. griseofulvum]|uniref:Uncharacterized protein n=1 Tax=Penicillium cf. griseofulvum TaxID=2972120 RepID=A0A9W9T6E4_9EURO|nr:hypothetical protein N7472_001341 [Penicillium cf. griseofulvum]KAJ5422577.1 hypothetical protein N7491_011022 [Penicillium cf. griseofulvum]KAJ5428755.1 hypothetical protein N7445_010209 [Penicillium cf. griseofulvum]